MRTFFKHIAALGLLLFVTQWASAQTDTYFLHTVTKGQGLYSISRMYGVTEEAIIALNPGSEVVIKVGEQLRIPQNKVVETTTTTPNEEARFHTIKTGETLYRLTVIYNLTAKEICDANPGLSAENFKVGQVVTIPQKKNEEPTVPATPKVTEPAPLIGKVEQQQQEPTVEKTSPTSSTCKTEHLVKRKENIYRISRMYDITELELMNANPELRERSLRRGEVICIPYATSEKDKKTSIEQKEQPIVAAIPTDEELFAESKAQPVNIEQIKAAIILPFMLDNDSINSDQQKMVEFYEGALLALDSLKSEGVSVRSGDSARWGV